MAAPNLLSMLRAADYARYLSVLFAPEQHRAALCALYLYATELSRVPQLVKEPFAGEIRLQWWQEVLEGKRDDEAEANPISKSLLDAVNQYQLPRQVLATMAEARIFDLYNDPMPDLKSFEGYCGEIYAAPYQLAVMILSRDATHYTAELSGHAGMVTGIAAVLRRLPSDLAAQKCPIPGEILAANGLISDQIPGLADQSKRISIADALQAFGIEHLDQFRHQRKTLKNTDKNRVLIAYLPIVFDEIHLKKVKTKYLFEKPFTPSPFMLTCRMFGRHLLG